MGNHISSKATVRHESPPGDQAQFDWTVPSVEMMHKSMESGKISTDKNRCDLIMKQNWHESVV